MTYHPDVSVIMPVYNAEKTIHSSVESILGQSYASWELLLIDDGSTDASYAIAQQISNSDDRVLVYSQENRGPSSARNHAITRSRGRYIAFLDADDHWSPDRLLHMIRTFVRTPDAGVLFSRVRFVDAQTGEFGTLTPHYEILDATTLLAENPVCTTSNIICRRELVDRIDGFKCGLDYAEDQDWLLRAALDDTWRICGVDFEGVYYASSVDSQSSDLAKMRAGWLSMVQDALNLHPSKVTSIENRASARFHRYLARRALRMRHARQALKYIIYALCKDPLLMIEEPRRTGLTLLGTLASLTKITKIEELVAR